MQEWEDTAFPAVPVVPAVFLVLVASIVVSVCCLQSAKARRARTSEFRRLQRLAIEELERAEAEVEDDYRRQKQVEAYKLDFRRRAAEGFDYRRRAEAESDRRQAEAEYYRRRQAEIEEHRRKQAEVEDSRRRQAEGEEIRRRQAEEEENRRRRAEAEVNRRRQAEAQEFRRKQAELEEEKRRQVEEEVRRRHAEVEAQLKKETEELSRRRHAEDEFLRKQKEGQAREHAVANGTGQKKGQTGANLYCLICQKPTKRRCARCKSVHYCSRQCQVQHWNEGHKLECRPPGSSSPASSESDTRNFSDFLSPRSYRSENDEIAAPGLSPAPSYANYPNISFSAPASPQSRSLLKTSSSVSADGRRLKPKKILFSYHHFIELFNWEIKFSPCGLINCGNRFSIIPTMMTSIKIQCMQDNMVEELHICFANVVLQCLTYTQPLTSYLFEGGHSESCKRTDWCFMCELRNHVWKVRQSESPFSPINILSQIQNIGNHLGYGKQEDAHEFMRFAIDSMQSIFLDGVGGEKAVDGLTQETTLIHYIFGGRLQSKVQCLQCLHESNRYENMMDLAVGIQGNVASLEDALTQFTAPEMLEGDNKYKCDRCKAYVGASKRLTVHEAPNILTIALKRFKSGNFGKLNKRVTFPEVLDMTPYMSENGDNPQPYKLYAVVVHVDMLNASYFGHYVCYVKNAHGSWYQVDDAKVKEVDLDKVASQRAYMLMYTRSAARPATFTDNPLAQVPPAANDISVSDRFAVPLERQQLSVCSPSMKIQTFVSNGAGLLLTPSIKIHPLVSDGLLIENVANYGDGSEFLRNGAADSSMTDPQMQPVEPVNGEALKAQGNMAAIRCTCNESGRFHEDLGSVAPLSLSEHSTGLSKSVVTTNKFVAVSQESPVQFAGYGEAINGRVEHSLSFCIPEQRVELTESSQQLQTIENELQEVEEEGSSEALMHVDGLNFDLCLRADESPIDPSRTGFDAVYATGTIDPRRQLFEGAYSATRQVGKNCTGTNLDLEKKVAGTNDTRIQVLPAGDLVTCSKGISHRDMFRYSGLLTSVSSEALLTSTTSELVFDSQVEVVKITGDIGGTRFDPQEFWFKKALPVELTGIANNTSTEKDSNYGLAKLRSDSSEECGVSRTQDGLQMNAEKKHPSLRSVFAAETSSNKCSRGSNKTSETAAIQTTAHDRREEVLTSKCLSAAEWEESDVNGTPKQLVSYERSAASSHFSSASEDETSIHQMDVHNIEGEIVQIEVRPIEGQMKDSAVCSHKQRTGSPRIERSSGVPYNVSTTTPAGTLFVRKDNVEIDAFSRVSARTFSGRLFEGCGQSCVCGSQRKWKKCCGRASVIMGDLALRRLVV